jgi:16S rRNA (adenine1518-N6/adenine1519-N6)-dimethyltransferase
VLVEAFFSVEKLFDVPPSAFRPPPKVQSSVVRITPKAMSIPNEPFFRTILSSAFRQKRKTILNNLKLSFENAADILNAAGIDRALRPEDLTLDNWIELSREADNSTGLT